MKTNTTVLKIKIAAFLFTAATVVYLAAFIDSNYFSRFAAYLLVFISFVLVLLSNLLSAAEIKKTRKQSDKKAQTAKRGP